MTAPRITSRMIAAHSLTSLQSGLGRLSNLQEQLSSGRTINRPSDSPTGTNDAMRLRAALAAKTQYTRNASDGKSWLDHADSTMTSMLDQVGRARELILAGASTGNNGAEARDALATELVQIRQSLLSEANTQHLGRPLFGGTTAGSVAYATDGTYVGDGNPVSRTVGEGVSVPVNVTGPAAFSAAGTDLFAVIDAAVTALRTDPTQVTGTLDSLDAVRRQMTSALADVGTRYNRVEIANDALASTTLSTRAALSEVENVDMASAIVDLQMQEVAYQASLGATARVIQPSLVDFLR